MATPISTVTDPQIAEQNQRQRQPDNTRNQPDHRNVQDVLQPDKNAGQAHTPAVKATGKEENINRSRPAAQSQEEAARQTQNEQKTQSRKATLDVRV